MTKLLASRIALVTGASRGIGYATAIALAREGAHIVATARTSGALEELGDSVRAAGGTTTLVPLELRDTDGILRLAAAMNERYGKLDIMVGNAALGGSNSPLDHIEVKEWDTVIAVNITANWHLIRAMDRLLKCSDAGRVVFLTSGAPWTARPSRGLYAISKGGLEVMARTYAAETASTPIKVNLFDPGATRTRMRADAMPGEDPMTLPSPEVVAEKIVQLCSPAFNESGKLYHFRFGKFLSFRPPA